MSIAGKAKAVTRRYNAPTRGEKSPVTDHRRDVLVQIYTARAEKNQDLQTGDPEPLEILTKGKK